jgi:putative membrane protein
MKIRFHALIFTLIIGLMMFGTTACQRTNDNVQAAREPAATTPESPTPAPANPSGEPASTADTITGADKEFVANVEKINIQERELGRLAQPKSQNDDVKDYGKMLERDHSEALEKLVDVMKKNGIPQTKGLPQAQDEAINKLRRLSGSAFDRQFVDMMVEGHQKAVEMFKEEANTAQNKDVRDYAKDTLPTLEKHLRDAKNLQLKLAHR